MGKGKKWSSDESLHLAEAWMAKSEEAGAAQLRGTNQDSDEFWSGVKQIFATKSPTPNPDGIYHDRNWTAIRNQWRDQIARDVKKFNKSLMKVYKSKPTGCTDQNKINMAVAMHTGKCDAMMYCHKDFESNNWKFYKCWLYLKSHRAFLPPSQESEEEENEDDAASTESNSGEDDYVLSTPDGDNTPALREQSRGPGAGARKTKAKSLEDECKQKKLKIQEGFLEVQRERQADFKMFVNNQARQQAFKMAVLGYNTFKDEDPDEAAKYKQTMENILKGNSC